MIGSGFSASAGQKTAGQIEKETKEFTAEIAENAEKKNLNNLCDEILLGTTSNFMFHTNAAEGEGVQSD